MPVLVVHDQAGPVKRFGGAAKKPSKLPCLASRPDGPWKGCWEASLPQTCGITTRYDVHESFRDASNSQRSVLRMRKLKTCVVVHKSTPFLQGLRQIWPFRHLVRFVARFCDAFQGEDLTIEYVAEITWVLEVQKRGCYLMDGFW